MMQPGSPLMSPASEMSNASNANNMNTMANHGMNNMYGGGAPPYPQLQQPGTLGGARFQASISWLIVAVIR